MSAKKSLLLPPPEITSYAPIHKLLISKYHTRKCLSPRVSLRSAPVDSVSDRPQLIFMVAFLLPVQRIELFQYIETSNYLNYLQYIGNRKKHIGRIRTGQTY